MPLLDWPWPHWSRIRKTQWPARRRLFRSQAIAAEHDRLESRVLLAADPLLPFDIRITQTGREGDPGLRTDEPAVAFNPATNQYLVVWEHNDIRDPDSANWNTQILGQFVVARTGQPTGDAFRVSDAYHLGGRPVVAYNSRANEYFVAWSGAIPSTGLSGIFGQRISAGGTEVGEDDFLISDGNAGGPAVAYNSTDDEYLVVWSGTDPGAPDLLESEIRGQRLTGTGSKLGDASFRISDMGPDGDASFDAWSPVVAYNSQDNEYVVIWRGDDDTGDLVDNDWQIFGQRLTAAGLETGQNDFRISDSPLDAALRYTSAEPALAYNSASNEYLVVWEAFHSPCIGICSNPDWDWWIVGQRLSADGIQLGEDDFRISNEGPDGTYRFDFDSRDPAVAYDSIRNEYLVVWMGVADHHLGIFAQRLLGTGIETGRDDARVSLGLDADTRFDALEPAIAFNSDTGEHFAVWTAAEESTPETEDWEIYAQRLGTPNVLIAAPGPGGGPVVRVFDAVTGQTLRQVWAYTPSFLGGASVAAADLNGDGFPEIITGPGRGGGPLVRVFDGFSGTMLNQFFAFGQAFRGGIHVAVADVDGDGTSEVIVAPRAGGGPAVRVFDALTGAQIGDTIWAFGRGFQGGVRIAGGDLDGDGTDEIIAAAGPGGGPAFRVFNGLSGAQIGETTFAYDRSFLGGLTVSAGDLDGDGHAEIIVGPGEGEIGPLLRVFDGTTHAQLSEFLAFGPGFTGGVAVAVGDVNGDGDLKVIAGAGPGGGPAVRVFDGLNGSQIGETLFAFGRAFRGGVVVAGFAPNLPGGSALTVDRSSLSIGSIGDPTLVLSREQLAPIAAAAETRLRDAGFSADLLASLSTVRFFVTDLAGDLLGLARPGRILLDVNAAGYGWFVDYSPLLDEEFFQDGSQLAALDGRAVVRIDLLTVVLHELGHALGLDHNHSPADGDALMSATLPTGIRRLTTAEDLDAFFAAGEWLDLVAV